jgi:hypothetical protein
MTLQLLEHRVDHVGALLPGALGERRVVVGQRGLAARAGRIGLLMLSTGDGVLGWYGGRLDLGLASLAGARLGLARGLACGGAGHDGGSPSAA